MESRKCVCTLIELGIVERLGFKLVWLTPEQQGLDLSKSLTI
jgi:hypothetical protein